jgi:hypothetical protein
MRGRAVGRSARSADQVRRDRLVVAVDVLTVLFVLAVVAAVVTLTLVLAANGTA